MTLGLSGSFILGAITFEAGVPILKVIGEFSL